jgi:molecular chaperone GrpE
MEAAPGRVTEKRDMSKHPSHREEYYHDNCDREPLPDADNGTGGPAERAGTEPQDPAQEQALTGAEDPGNAAEAGTTEETMEKTEEAGETPACGPAGGEEAAQDGGCPGAEERIAELEAQLADYKDQLLRKAAEGENFRKRMNREKQDAIDFANQNLLLDLIPILDDFDRAMQSAESSRDFDALYEGLGMIARRLRSTLDGKWGLKSYVSAGTPFDPNFHEALMMEKSSAVAEQTVQMDLLKGYTLKSRVIRSAKVKVLDPDPSAPAIEAPKPAGNLEKPAEGEGEKAAEPEAQA